MTTLNGEQVRAWRARAQGLDAAGRAPAGDVAGLVRSVAALQSQDTKACRLQLRARARDAVPGDHDAALRGPGPTLVRSWLMRGTLHLVPAADLRWLNDLLGPRFADAAPGRRRQLGLDDETLARALPLMDKALAGRGPTRREELVRRLGELGLPLDAGTQAPAHLLMFAAHRGLICRGPDDPGDRPTYVLREEWLDGVPGPRPAGDEALAELAARHVGAYGPVTPADFARWAGLPLGAARRAFAILGDRLAEVGTPAGPMWVAREERPPDAAPGVRLLGHFDPYLLGYQDRDLLADPRHVRRIATGGGLLMPTVLVDGLAAGLWRHELRGRRLTVRVEPFEPLPPGTESAIDAEVADLGRFLGVDAAWHHAPC